MNRVGLLKDGRRVTIVDDDHQAAAAARTISKRLFPRRYIAVRDNDGAISYLPISDIVNVMAI